MLGDTFETLGVPSDQDGKDEMSNYLKEALLVSLHEFDSATALVQ